MNLKNQKREKFYAHKMTSRARRGRRNNNNNNNNNENDSIEEPSFPNDYSQIGSNMLQANKCAIGDTNHYTIEWNYLDDIAPTSTLAEEIQEFHGRGRNTLDGSVVRGLNVGDSISVWGRARFRGWENYVEKVSVRVFWAV